MPQTCTCCVLVELPYKSDMIWQVIFSLTGHENVKEIFSTYGQQLYLVLACYRSGTFRVVQQRKFLRIRIMIVFCLTPKLTISHQGMGFGHGRLDCLPVDSNCAWSWTVYINTQRILKRFICKRTFVVGVI